jgi:hypothetical protein
LTTMSEAAKNTNRASESDRAHLEQGDSPFPAWRVQLEGRHSLLSLVRRGRVRLFGEDGATVDLWEPVQVDGSRHRVRLAVSFSDGMRERYADPLPDNPTALISEFKEIEPGSPDLNLCGFRVEGWGLYSPAGERVRHDSRTFVLRGISGAELLLPGDPCASTVVQAIGASAIA